MVENVLFSTNANYFLQKSGKIFYTSIDMSMSGAPILQDGKFVGAVTHVLVQPGRRGQCQEQEAQRIANGPGPSGPMQKKVGFRIHLAYELSALWRLSLDICIYRNKYAI